MNDANPTPPTPPGEPPATRWTYELSPLRPDTLEQMDAALAGFVNRPPDLDPIRVTNEWQPCQPPSAC